MKAINTPAHPRCLLTFALLTIAGLMASSPARANVPGGGNSGSDVKFSHNGKYVVLSNGIVSANIDTEVAQVEHLVFKGHEMTGKPIYFSRDGGTDYEQLAHCVFTLTKQTADYVDVSCKHIYSPSKGDKHAWDVDVHFVMTRGASGLYVYTINSHPASYPEMGVGEWRMVWPTPVRGDEWVLEDDYIDDLRHWQLPSAGDYKRMVAVPDAPKEVTQFTSGSWSGKYDCKYVYVTEYWDHPCWGYASDKNHLGSWLVFGSDEFFTDGPMKQDLTATLGSINLVHLNMNHFGGTGPQIPQGTSWQKVYGPYLLYLNDKASGDECWADAKEQAKAEATAWPYAWAVSSAYPGANDRGSVTGKFVVTDTLKPDVNGANAWVGIALPESGHEGGFQFQSEYYQYWVHAASDGSFKIPNIRPGQYTLYAFTNGAVGEYARNNVTVSAGRATTLGDVVWNVPHHGSKIAWEIGVPDRRSTEFKHGNDYFTPMLYKTNPQEFPNPLEYYVGKSDYKTDWNYVQSYYYEGTKRVPHRWNIHFNLDSSPDSTSTLTLAIAGSYGADLDVYVNSNSTVYKQAKPKFPNHDGSPLVRESDHGKYEVLYVPIGPGKLHAGENTISLVQTNMSSDQNCINYDYLALELP